MVQLLFIPHRQGPIERVNMTEAAAAAVTTWWHDSTQPDDSTAHFPDADQPGRTLTLFKRDLLMVAQVL